jgi:Zn-dependent peptidase ImmA (M78 family)/ribosomal protein L37E
MVIKGFIEPDFLRTIVENKLKSLRITRKDYPLKSRDIIDLYCQKGELELEYIRFNSIKIGGILYKDPRKSFMALNSNRSKKGQNFDGMHELIHFWFHPYTEYFCNDNNRKVFYYKGFEWQANEGAAIALMPEDLFIEKYIAFNGEISALSDFFLVGEMAVVYRMINLGLDDKFVFLQDSNRDILKQYDALICPVCHNSEININSLYCSICGQFLDALIIKGDDYLIYNDGVQMDENKKMVKCPRCDNEEFSSNANFCRICGLATQNKCEGYYDQDFDEYIEHDCPGNARYCEICGRPTTFFKEGVLKPWDKAKKELESINDNPFNEAAVTDYDFDIPF